MNVYADQLWVTSSTLVVRVHVVGDDGTWRLKRYCSIDLDDVPEEAVASLIAYYQPSVPDVTTVDDPLF